MEECGQTKVTKTKEPKRCPNSGTMSNKKAFNFNHVKTISQVVYWPIWTIKKSLRVTEMLPAINLEQ
jgi:hypothetical protein